MASLSDVLSALYEDATRGPDVGDMWDEEGLMGLIGAGAVKGTRLAQNFLPNPIPSRTHPITDVIMKGSKGFEEAYPELVKQIAEANGASKNNDALARMKAIAAGNSSGASPEYSASDAPDEVYYKNNPDKNPVARLNDPSTTKAVMTAADLHRALDILNAGGIAKVDKFGITSEGDGDIGSFTKTKMNFPRSTAETAVANELALKNRAADIESAKNDVASEQNKAYDRRTDIDAASHITSMISEMQKAGVTDPKLMASTIQQGLGVMSVLDPSIGDRLRKSGKDSQSALKSVQPRDLEIYATLKGKQKKAFFEMLQGAGFDTKALLQADQLKVFEE